ncbi:hypothetical protein AB0C14_28775 [Microbispora hainanensis]|uniref:hypothetical protein n=1 Tax=Microbispora hainanensis TaxID=568844 RepID=UPI0034028119
MRKRSMILAGVIMTVGLGVGGSTAASAASTGTPKPGVVCAVKGGPAAVEKGKSTVRLDKDGRVFVDGKEIPKNKLKNLCVKPPLPGKGVVCMVHHKGGTFRGDPIRRVKLRNGRVFVDGKEVPKNKRSALCKKLPLPGKGVVCMVHKKRDESGFVTSDEKVYVDGKPAHATCPLPKKPGEGMDDVHVGDDTPVIVTPS